MLFLYLQTLKTVKKKEIPYHLVIGSSDFETIIHFKIRPEITLSKKEYVQHHIDREALLAVSPFYDIADELIEIFQEHRLVFSEMKQFKLLEAQFKTIGYNFNVSPVCIWNSFSKTKEDLKKSLLLERPDFSEFSPEFAEIFLKKMTEYHFYKASIQPILKTSILPADAMHLYEYKKAAGVYFFLNSHDQVIYVGKAKNIRRRLQSHFSKITKNNAIDYSQVHAIKVTYTGNEIIAELIESKEIKALKPLYNIQQVHPTPPFIIQRTESAKGIFKLKITRKDIEDNRPERYFNKMSVKMALTDFCTTYDLCRKYCGLEKVKGPCSNVTHQHTICVCVDKASIEAYNKRFERAFAEFQKRKSRKIYKLKGRHPQEDAFIYMVNGIYEGYGFIDKEESVTTHHDILSHLISQTNTYETSRIVSSLSHKISPQNTLVLAS